MYSIKVLFSTPFPVVPVVHAEDVTVMEIDGVAVVTFIRTGDLSYESRFNIRLKPGSAISRKLLSITLYMALIDARNQCNRWGVNFSLIAFSGKCLYSGILEQSLELS